MKCGGMYLLTRFRTMASWHRSSRGSGKQSTVSVVRQLCQAMAAKVLTRSSWVLWKNTVRPTVGSVAVVGWYSVNGESAVCVCVCVCG